MSEKEEEREKDRRRERQRQRERQRKRQRERVPVQTDRARKGQKSGHTHWMSQTAVSHFTVHSAAKAAKWSASLHTTKRREGGRGWEGGTGVIIQCRGVGYTETEKRAGRWRGRGRGGGEGGGPRRRRSAILLCSSD